MKRKLNLFAIVLQVVNSLVWMHHYGIYHNDLHINNVLLGLKPFNLIKKINSKYNNNNFVFPLYLKVPDDLPQTTFEIYITEQLYTLVWDFGRSITSQHMCRSLFIKEFLEQYNYFLKPSRENLQRIEKNLLSNTSYNAYVGIYDVWRFLSTIDAKIKFKYDWLENLINVCHKKLTEDILNKPVPKYTTFKIYRKLMELYDKEKTNKK